jgi:16S rRNA C967 or C1407 C5-methylase (RsmB/RsmF family)
LSLKGAEGFEAYYSEVFGARWAALKTSLNEPVKKISRPNAFATIDKNLTEIYEMDAASTYPPKALVAKPGEEVLDMCAAPGGKSLILAESLFANGDRSGKLVVNELSDKRRARLRAVLNDYLPEDVRTCMSVASHDGTRWCLYEQETFDRILLDAPCSGERHLLADPSEMKLWSKARSKNLAVRQYALLVSALQVVRHGGRIVYSTCALSPLENDDVIARMLKKRSGEATVVPLEFDIGEKTEHGWQILPDRTGSGPIYLAAIERV